MEPDKLKGWLQSRIPPPPAPFLPHLVEDEGEPFGGPLGLEAAGAERILQALAFPGRHRKAAFDLLAGDAYLTYACESMTEEDHPHKGLEALLERLGDRFR